MDALQVLMSLQTAQPQAQPQPQPQPQPQQQLQQPQPQVIQMQNQPSQPSWLKFFNLDEALANPVSSKELAIAMMVSLLSGPAVVCYYTNILVAIITMIVGYSINLFAPMWVGMIYWIMAATAACYLSNGFTVRPRTQQIVETTIMGVLTLLLVIL